jgi:hypothetical protein
MPEDWNARLQALHAARTAAPTREELAARERADARLFDARKYPAQWQSDLRRAGHALREAHIPTIQYEIAKHSKKSSMDARYRPTFPKRLAAWCVSGAAVLDADGRQWIRGATGNNAKSDLIHPQEWYFTTSMDSDGQSTGGALCYGAPRDKRSYDYTLDFLIAALSWLGVRKV